MPIAELAYEPFVLEEPRTEEGAPAVQSQLHSQLHRQLHSPLQIQLRSQLRS